MEKISEKIINDKIRFVQDTLYVVGGKWKLPILIAIYYGNNRFTAIKNAVPGITSHTLSKELKLLEANQLVVKTVYSPKEAIYEFAQYGKSLSPLIREMTEWGKQHRKKIMGK